MREAIPTFPQYAFMVWCSVKETAQGQLYHYLCMKKRLTQLGEQPLISTANPDTTGFFA